MKDVLHLSSPRFYPWLTKKIPKVLSDNWDTCNLMYYSHTVNKHTIIITNMRNFYWLDPHFVSLFDAYVCRENKLWLYTSYFTKSGLRLSLQGAVKHSFFWKDICLDLFAQELLQLFPFGNRRSCRKEKKIPKSFQRNAFFHSKDVNFEFFTLYIVNVHNFFYSYFEQICYDWCRTAI